MNSFWILPTFAAVLHAATLPIKIMKNENGELWKAWKGKYDKAYETQAEELNRFKIWSENLKEIGKHNVEYEFGLHTYTKALNMFADMTQEEFKATYTGCSPPEFPEVFVDSVYEKIDTSNLPNEVDWRKEGYVTSVKNQGYCGSCWIFSAIGALEGQHFNSTKQLVSLSEQQVVDCYGRGCSGGYPYMAFDYLEKDGSISFNDYPYTSQNGEAGAQCMYSSYPIAATMSSYVNLPKGSEAALQVATATVGPISVCVNATAFWSYGGGVFNDPNCGNTGTDHCVVVVGYGTDETSGKDYWLVKNSWGTGFGNEGYIKMARNNNNMCAIANWGSYPVV